jgi:predicted Zn-dependent peptidase
VRTLDEGTITHPSSEYAIALEEVGATFHGMVGFSTTQCLLDLPYDSLYQGLGLLAEAVTSPAYADEDVHRIQANRLFEIEQQESRGSFLASAALRKSLLNSDLRISRPAGGSHEQVSRLTRKDVYDYHRKFYSPEGATLIISGDLRSVDVMDAVNNGFSTWNPTTETRIPQVSSPGSAQSHLIHREGSVQSDIRLGWFGIDRKDPRWPALQVALAIMGGTFNSRLNTALREEKGYTYGVSMNAHPFRQYGTIDVATSTRTSTTADLIAYAKEILKADTPFTEDEVRDAIGYLTLSAPLALDTADAVAAQAATIAAAQLDLDHVSTSLATLNLVTPKSAMEAFKDLVDPEKVTTIVVGDSHEISDQGISFD